MKLQRLKYNKKSNDNLIRSVQEEHMMEQNTLLSNTSNATQIQLYHDDIEITNALELENQNLRTGNVIVYYIKFDPKVYFSILSKSCSIY